MCSIKWSELMKSKDEIYDLIINDTEAYNEYKSSTSEELELSELDFSSQDIYDADFTDSDMVDSSFFESTLTKCSFVNCDLTSVDFSRTKLIECDFSDALLNGTNFSYSQIEYCNYTDSDMAGAILLETTFDNTDLSASLNLQASRFDETTVWPDDEYLPDGFDSKSASDLSDLKDEEDYNSSDSDY